jgi:hypothetical protein
MDILDPVLNNLLEDLVSLRKDSFTEASKETVISMDCLNHARNHGMIDDLEFRPFRNGDESLITLGVSIPLSFMRSRLFCARTLIFLLVCL